jgi:hypothetical protein
MMPEPEIKQLPSIWGYINWRELRNIVIASNVLQALLDSVVIPVLQNHSLWLAEPWSSRVAPFIALIIALLSGREFGRRMIRQGN